MSDHQDADNPKPVDYVRRRLLVTTSVVAAGMGAISVIPFLASLGPSTRAQAAGMPVEVNISALPMGELMVVEWRGKPVWVLRRSQEMLNTLSNNRSILADPDSLRMPDTFTPPYCRNEHRSLRPELLIALGICTHLGCSPTPRLEKGAQPGLPNNWAGGFLCACHGSLYDLAGRVFKNMPAPDNLEIPPYHYTDEGLLVVGLHAPQAKE